MMILETKLDFKKYLKFMFTITYRSPMAIFSTIVGFIIFLIAGLNFMGMNMPFDEPPYFQIVFGFFIIAFLPFSIYRSAKKIFTSHGRLQEKIIYEFTDQKMKVTGETFNSEMDWTKTYKVLELNDWILIYQNSIVANILPKESFGENLTEFRDLIRRKNIKAKLKK